jgi:hypothetical protein
MASVQHTEQQQQRIDLGQRLFLLGIFAVTVCELVGIFVNLGPTFAWTSLLLNGFATVFIVYLGNWLYSGDKTALAVARTWVPLMAIVAGFGLACQWAELTHPDFGRYVGITAVWLGLLKFIVYGTFALCLLTPGYVLDFLAAQRGETVAPASAVEQEATTGMPAELTTEHVTLLGRLAGAMKNASFVLLVVGLFEACASVARFSAENNISAILNVVEGLAVASLGCLLMAPTRAVQALVGAANKHMGYVMQMLARFQALYVAYLVTFGVLAVVAVCRVVFAAL